MTTFSNTISIYLSGPISFAEDEWRESLVSKVEKIGRDFSVKVNVYVPSEEEIMTDEEIILRDIEAIDHSDVVLCHIHTLTFGSSMEIWYTHRRTLKPVWLIYTMKGKPSPWLTGNCAKFFRSRRSFYKFFREYLLEINGAD